MPGSVLGAGDTEVSGVGLERIRAWAVAFDHGHWDTATQDVSNVRPNIAVSSSAIFPAALTSMGWEGFSTGSSTSGFLG